MIPMISQEVVEKGWLTLEEVQSFIAISESTPGPFAVNIATYTGVSVLQSAGVGESMLGAICATFGVVLPSLIIITLIALVFSNFIKNLPCKAFLCMFAQRLRGFCLRYL